MIPKNQEIRFEICTKCNYNCGICPRESFIRGKEVMSTEMFEQLLENIQKSTSQYSHLTFSGYGEPFLDGDILSKVRIARERGLQILMLTNGSLLTKKKFSEIDALGVESVRVSFYGMTSKTYAGVHGVPNNGKFNTLRDELVAICESSRNTKMLFTLNIIQGENDHEVEDWITFWESKADLIEVWRPHNWVDGRAFRDVADERLQTCGRPEKGPLQVQVDGTVNMCCFDFNGQLLLGDLKTMSLGEVFESPAFLHLQGVHRTGEYEGSGLICEHCDQRNANRKDVMAYSSGLDLEKPGSIADRLNRTSTTYSQVSA